MASGFILSEAYIKIESQGFAAFKRDITAVNSQLQGLGTKVDTVSMKLKRAFSGAGIEQYKRQIASVEKEFQRISNKARPSTTARQKANAKQSGTLFPKQNFSAIDKGLQGIIKKLGEIEKQLKGIGSATQTAFGNQGLWRDTNGRLGDAKGKFAKLRNEIGGTGKAAGGFNNTFKNTRYSLVHAGYALQALPKELRFVVSGMADLGTAAASGLGAIPILASAATLSIVALGGAAIKAVGIASKLETGLAEVATISQEVSKDIDKFATRIGKLSIVTRTESGLLSKGLYQTISAGITDTADAFRFLEVGANAARAGLSSVEVAISGLTSAVSSYGYKADQVDIVADKFFKTVEVGKLRFEDLSSSIGKVAPLASQLGVSLDELLATGSALTLTGSTLTQSFTSLQGIMNAVLRPSEKAKKLAAELGLEFTATALQSKGLAKFLTEVKDATGGNLTTMGQLFGRVEGLRGVIALTGTQAEAFARNLEAIKNAAGATDKAVAIQNKTFQAQVDLLKTQLAFVLQQIGQELLPTLTEALKKLSDDLNKVDWDSFRESVKESIAVVVTLVEEIERLAKGTARLFKFLKGLSESVEVVVKNPVEKLTTASETVKQGLYTGRKAKEFDLKKLAADAGVSLPSTKAKDSEQKGIRVALPVSKETTTTLPEVVPTTTGKTAAQKASALATSLDSLIGAFNQFRMGIESPERSVFESATPDANKSGEFLIAEALNNIAKVDRAPIEFKQDVTLPDSTKAFNKTITSLAKRTSDAAKVLIPSFVSIEKENMALAGSTKEVTDAIGDLPSDVGELDKLNQGFLGNIKTTGELQENVNRLWREFSESGRTDYESFRDGMLENTQIIIEGLQKSGEFLQSFEAQGLSQSPIGDTPLTATGQPSSFTDMGSLVPSDTVLALQDSGLMLANSFTGIGAAIEGGMAGGLPGALIAFGTELLLQTEGFQRVQKMWDKLFGKLVAALEPVISVIADALEPVFEALGEVIIALAPAFELLGKILSVTLVPAMKILAFVIEGIATGVRLIVDLVVTVINTIIDVLNKLPFVDIAKIGDDRSKPTNADRTLRDTTIGRTERNAIREGGGSGIRGESGDVTRGISVSKITGETRSIFVDLLRPLQELNVMGKILSELINIRSVLTPGMRPPSQSAAPGAPSQRGDFVNRQQDFLSNRQGGARDDGFGQNGEGTIVIQEFNVHVNQLADLDIEEINRQINQRLRLENRGRGFVFQAEG